MSNFKIETSPCGETCLVVERSLDFLLLVREILAGRVAGEAVQYRSSSEELFWYGGEWFQWAWLDAGDGLEPYWVNDDHQLPDWVVGDHQLSPYED